MRAVTVKVTFFREDFLGDCSLSARMLLVGIWSLTDADGCVEYRPKRILCDCFPYNMSVDVETLIEELIGAGAITILPDPTIDHRRLKVVGPQRFFDLTGPHNPKRHAFKKLSRNERLAIYERDGHTCQYCGSIERLSIDHVTPLSRGGSNDPTNLVTACKACNDEKHARTPKEWL